MCRYDETTLPPEPSAAGHARAWVTDRLSEWDVGDAAEDLRLVASELVSNAVLHARTKVGVTLSIAEGVIELTVRDYDPRPPRPRRRLPDDAATGRGLILVDALSDDWGVVQRTGGKEVWLRREAPQGCRYTSRCVCPEPPSPDARRLGSGHRVVVMDPKTLPGDA